MRGLIQAEANDVLKQAQDLFCLRELVVSSNPGSGPHQSQRVRDSQKAILLEESLEKTTF